MCADMRTAINYFDAIAAQLTGTEVAPKVKPSRPRKSPTSLSIARCEVLGISADSGSLGYVEWRELKRILSDSEEILDRIVTDREGKPTSAISWAGKASVDDVVDVLEAAVAVRADLVVPPKPPTRRPWVDVGLVSSFKRRNVLVGALDVAAVAAGRSLVDTASSVTDDLHKADDWELLAALDDVADGGGHTELRPTAKVVKELWDLDPEHGPTYADWRLGHLLAALVEDANNDTTDRAISSAAKGLIAAVHD